MFAFMVDYGYSNYTTEGTYFYCGLNKHPNGPFDRGWKSDPRLSYALDCEYFAGGKPVEMDVERDNAHEQSMNPAQLILWRSYVRDAAPPPDDATRVP
jgi:hypothetical protein